MKPFEMRLADFMGPGSVNPGIEVSNEDYIFLSSASLDMERGQRIGEFSDCCIEDLDDYWVVPTRNGRDVAIIHDPGDGSDAEAVGLYQGKVMNIVPDHRSLGLGAILALAAARLRGGCPGADEYTSAGYAAHVAAHRMAVEWALSRGQDVQAEVLGDHGLLPDLPTRAPAV